VGVIGRNIPRDSPSLTPWICERVGLGLRGRGDGDLYICGVCVWLFMESFGEFYLVVVWTRREVGKRKGGRLESGVEWCPAIFVTLTTYREMYEYRTTHLYK
jgi:hypothetical protein